MRNEFVDIMLIASFESAELQLCSAKNAARSLGVIVFVAAFTNCRGDMIVRGIMSRARSLATSSPRGTARLATQPLPPFRLFLTRRQLVSALPMGSYMIDGQRKATILGKIQVVTPSTPHAGIRDSKMSSVLRTCVVNHVAASVSGTSSMEDSSSLWTVATSGMGRISESEEISGSDGGAPASRRCSKTGNLGCHASRSLWKRLGFWLPWSGLAEAMHNY